MFVDNQIQVVKEKEKKVKEAKGYKNKIKKHKDAVLSIHSLDGLEGHILISGSADHTVKIFNLKKTREIKKISVQRPPESEVFKHMDHQQEIVNYAPEHILNTPGALQRQKNNRFVCCFCFIGDKIYTGYEDGLICSFNHNEQFLAPLIGHTNRINSIISTLSSYIITMSNDCTVRQWDSNTGKCLAIFKFADPISCGIISPSYNMLFTASWDKMIRCIDLEQNKVVKSFVASKEAITCMQLSDSHIFVAGCDPIIRSFNIATGETKLYQGHKGWIYTIEIMGERMYSGGDDRSIIIWNIETTKMLEQLMGHENGVTSIGFAHGDLYTGSFDHCIICWDLNDLEERIGEKELMRQADIESRRFEVYWRLMDAKKGKKKKGKAGGAKKAAASTKKTKGKK